MASLPALTFLLGNTKAQQLFKAIVNQRRLQGRELVRLGQPATREEIYNDLERLKQLSIIDVDASVPIEDFRTYYVTAEGLSTAKELGRIEAASASDMLTGL